jgi:hypothetical protein
MNRWLAVSVLAVLALAGALSVCNLVASPALVLAENGGGPIPPWPTLAENGGGPITPWPKLAENVGGPIPL